MEIDKNIIIEKKDKIYDGILKKALGFSVSEKTEEFGLIDGELQLIKKKVSTKYYPPDLSAIEIVLDSLNDKSIGQYKQMSIEELQKEKLRLLEELYNLKEK